MRLRLGPDRFTGLPVSVKDQFSIKGLDTTMGACSGRPSIFLTPAIGYTAWIGIPADKNCTLVDMLLAAGAVPFVRTNVPQTLMVRDHFVCSLSSQRH